MVRALITLSDKALKSLDRLAKQGNKSRAEVMREAVDRYIKENENQEKNWKEVLLKTAGIWKHKGISTDEYLADIRKDWEGR